jgi:hypothetical protein
MDLIKFGLQKSVFKSNIPFIHPYSEADRKRDRELERLVKEAKVRKAAIRNGNGFVDNKEKEINEDDEYTDTASENTETGRATA